MKIAWCLPLLLLAAGCGADQQPQQQPTVTVTAPASTPTAAPTSTVAPPPSKPPTPPQESRSAVVPAVVGVNHQLAQDMMQAAGFFYLTEEDATGQGRLLVNDRNWVVVTQSPAAGTTAAVDSKIVLRSKKIGE
ncbi:PASTA domain-containing protein [Kribbella sp. NPDC056861]|uniref:PASTA domain-containing protein n=1 Tax=Kribbella sp. NPDC056861 TaxID=3154857 RepID=UPI0034263F1C